MTGVHSDEQTPGRAVVSDGSAVRDNREKFKILGSFDAKSLLKLSKGEFYRKIKAKTSRR
jgi:hypothetical protein